MHRDLDDPEELLSVLLGFIMALLLGMKMSILLKMPMEVGGELNGSLDLFLNTSAKGKKGQGRIHEPACQNLNVEYKYS